MNESVKSFVLCLIAAASTSMGCDPEDLPADFEEGEEEEELVERQSASHALEYQLSSQANTATCMDANGGHQGIRPYMGPCGHSTWLVACTFNDLQTCFGFTNGNQVWAYQYVKNVGGLNYFYIRNILEGKCLDAGGSVGAEVYLNTCNPNNDNHLWRWGSSGSQIRNLAINACLDAANGGVGAYPYMRDCSDASNLNLIWEGRY